MDTMSMGLTKDCCPCVDLPVPIHVHGTAACRYLRESDDVAEVDRDAVELLRLHVTAHLQLFGHGTLIGSHHTCSWLILSCSATSRGSIWHSRASARLFSTLNSIPFTFIFCACLSSRVLARTQHCGEAASSSARVWPSCRGCGPVLWRTTG